MKRRGLRNPMAFWLMMLPAIRGVFTTGTGK